MEDTKIDLSLSGSEIFVWSADDWLRLRQEYRILGDCIGCIAKKPRQESISGLPLILMPEETNLLLEKGIGRLIHQPILKETPSESIRKKFVQYRNKLFEEQQECLVNQRKLQVASVMDKIVDGKRRKMLGLNTSKKKLKKDIDEETKKALDNIEIDREALFAQEVAKLPKLEKCDALIQTHTAYPWKTGVFKVENWNYPSTDEEKFKYQVYKDIWEQGFYITSGHKFGCDFLAYPGDPIMFHSQFLIHCKNREEDIPVAELIAISRISSHVRKSLVFATLSKDKESVEYFTSRWADSSMGEL